MGPVLLAIFFICAWLSLLTRIYFLEDKDYILLILSFSYELSIYRGSHCGKQYGVTLKN